MEKWYRDSPNEWEDRIYVSSLLDRRAKRLDQQAEATDRGDTEAAIFYGRRLERIDSELAFREMEGAAGGQAPNLPRQGYSGKVYPTNNPQP